jgi:group I intron endonuclease
MKGRDYYYNKEPGVYTITNKINNKIYVGSTTGSITKRLREHITDLSRNIHQNKYLQRSYNKYGKENFIFEKLEDYEVELCISMEKYWINMLDSKNPERGYNINDPVLGRHGIRHAQESIEKAKNTMKVRQHSKGEKNPNFGNKWSDEIKLKNRLSQPTRKEVVKYSLNGEKLSDFNSIVEAALSIGNKKYSGQISKVCNRHQKTAYGFIWKFKNIDNE